MNILKILKILALSIILAACGDKGNDTAGSTTTNSGSDAGPVDDGSHVVVYEEEIYKNWPYQ